jgi:hypothetical protein
LRVLKRLTEPLALGAPQGSWGNLRRELKRLSLTQAPKLAIDGSLGSGNQIESALFDTSGSQFDQIAALIVVSYRLSLRLLHEILPLG